MSNHDLIRGAPSARLRSAAAILLFGACLVSAVPSRGQTVSVDTVPSFGVLGSITGSVTGVSNATHRVAAYIYIEGSGWWTKPYSAFPTVSISPSGHFVVNVGTGGLNSLDGNAVIFCAYLYPAGVSPTVVLGSGELPLTPVPIASGCKTRYGKTLSFAGRTWGVKEAPQPVGPGPNVFSRDDVWVDSEGLHLRISYRGGRWWSSEAVLLDELGYGVYRVETESRLDTLDVGATFGLFTWDPRGGETRIPAAPNREIDFEDSKWGSLAELTTSQTVIQPWQLVQNLRRYSLPDLSTDARLTRFVWWTPERIRFRTLKGSVSPFYAFSPTTDVIDAHDYEAGATPDHIVPTPGHAQFRANLWLNSGASFPLPANGQTIEIVITDFEFVPEPKQSVLLIAGVVGVGAFGSLGRRRPLWLVAIGVRPRPISLRCVHSSL